MNFSSPSNPDGKIVLGQYKNFKSIFKDIMVVLKKDVDEMFPNSNSHTTQQIGETQYKNFIKTTSIFLNQQVVYKHGSVNGFDIVTTFNGAEVSTIEILLQLHKSNQGITANSDPLALKDCMTFPSYDASLYPGGATTPSFATLISDWIIPTLEVGVNTQFTQSATICFDFFVNFNISPTLVKEFAPILKFYLTLSKQSSSPNTGVSKQNFVSVIDAFI